MIQEGKHADVKLILAVNVPALGHQIQKIQVFTKIREKWTKLRAPYLI
jgi:hypothetical protein